MSLSAQPTQTEGSTTENLGQVKVDDGVYVDPTKQVKVLFWNNLVAKFVELWAYVASLAIAPASLKFVGALYTSAGSTSTVMFDGAPVSGGSNLPPIFYPVAKAFSVSALYANVIANSSTTAGAVTLYKNGSATAMTCGWAGLATGVFNDVTHTISFVPGDTYGVALTNTAGGVGHEIDVIVSLA